MMQAAGSNFVNYKKNKNELPNSMSHNPTLVYIRNV